MVSPRALLPTVLAMTALQATTTWAAPTAPENDEDPRAVEARKACASGRVDRGIQLLADYFSKTNDATAIFNMARCYQQNGVADKAVLNFREYLRQARDLTPQDRLQVDNYIRELEAQQQARPATGPPALTASAPAAPEPPTHPPVLRTAAIVLGAAGVAAVAAGVAFGLKVRSVNGDLHDQTRTPDWPSYERRQKDGLTAETWQWVMLGVGGASLIGGAVCAVLSLPPRRESVTTLAAMPLPGGAGLVLAGRY
jgi:hypothetical protein